MVIIMLCECGCGNDISDFLSVGGAAYFSVQTDKDIKSNVKDTWTAESDGWVTSIGTFQHGFEADELVSSAEAFFESVELIKKSPHIIVAR